MPQILTRSTARNRAEWNLHLIAVFSPPLVEMTDDRCIGGHSNTYLNVEKIMALLCAPALTASTAFIEFRVIGQRGLFCLINYSTECFVNSG